MLSRVSPHDLVERDGVIDELFPVADRLRVDFNDARVGSDLDVLNPCIVRREIALEDDRHLEVVGGAFDGGDQIEIVLQTIERRHEDVQPPLSRLDAEGGADDGGRRLAGGGGVRFCRSLADAGLADRIRAPGTKSWPRYWGVGSGGGGSRADRADTGSASGRPGTHGSDSMGSRRPTGESPGIRNIWSVRIGQRPLVQRGTEGDD